MFLPVGFLMKIASETTPIEQKTGMMSIVIRRPYAHLERELRDTFEGQRDVCVVIDRRRGERREETNPVSVDRRTATRRCPKEEIVDIVMSV